jgi:dolichol-phosphate mannosyltransferase
MNHTADTPSMNESIAELAVKKSGRPAGDAASRIVRDSDARLRGVSVIVPLFNERECVDSLVRTLSQLETLHAASYDCEFLLVNDGSTDDTAPLLRAAILGRANYRVIDHGANRGIAAAIQTGLQYAQHEIAASIDCDGSYDLALIAEMIPRLESGVDLVTASPYHPLGRVENVPPWRLRLSRSASRLYAIACGQPLACYTSCFRVYRRSAVADLSLENAGFVGVAELLCKVAARGGRVVEHPAVLRSRVAGQSKMRIMRTASSHLRLLGRLLVRRISGAIGGAISR